MAPRAPVLTAAEKPLPSDSTSTAPARTASAGLVSDDPSSTTITSAAPDAAAASTHGPIIPAPFLFGITTETRTRSGQVAIEDLGAVLRRQRIPAALPAGRCGGGRHRLACCRVLDQVDDGIDE